MLNKSVRLLAGAGFLVILFKFLGDEGASATLDNLSRIDVFGWFILIGLSLMLLVQLSVLFLISVRVVDKKIPFGIAFCYTSMNSFFNNVLPLKGGVWVRGLYLKRNFGLAWKRYLFLVLSSQLLHIIILFCIFIVSLLFVEFSFDLESNKLLKIALPLGTGVVVMGLLFLFRAHPMITRLIESVRVGLRMWFKDPKLLANYMAMTVLLHFLAGFRLWYSFDLGGYTFNFFEIVFLYTALAIGLSWGVTPGNLGVKEAAIVLLAVVLGIDANIALSASVIDRVASLLVITLVGGISSILSARPFRADVATELTSEDNSGNMS